MPLPTPRKTETEKEFIGRCMASSVSTKDFPDIKQRYAVCQSKWEEHKKEGK